MQRVLEGIQAAAEVGMKIKINMVVQKENEQDILQMAQYFKENKHIRFIEYMDVGNYNGWDLKEVVSKQEIVDTIHQVMPLERIEAKFW